MRSHGKSKRSRSNKEEDVYMNTQVDDIHSDSYSRSRSSFSSSESYRVQSASGRAAYVADRDVVPRSRRSDDWHHTDMDQDRYPYDHVFAHDNGLRSSAGWGPVDPPHPQSRSNWPSHYDNGASSTSYQEMLGWGNRTPNPYDDPPSSYRESWVPPDSRAIPAEDWSPTSSRMELPSERRQQDWRPEARRDKHHSTGKFRSDSGWNSRRRERPEWGSDVALMRNDTQNDLSAEDRAWEPAASWKSSSSNEYQHQRGQNGQRANETKLKRGQYQHKQRREWRSDDGDLNNWTRRDAGPSATTKPPSNQYPPRRKHPRSPSHSRSRSRSPTNSYRSHRSSRGRSRSRSFSPASKRRRRDSSPIVQRSGENGNPSHNRKEGYPSRSPSPVHKSVASNNRRRSPSVTTTNSERSRSRSPIPPVRSVHRLPSQNHANGDLQNILAKGSGNESLSRKSDETRNGKSRSNRQNRKGKEPRFFSNAEHEFASMEIRPTHERPFIYERPINHVTHGSHARSTNPHPGVYDRPAMPVHPPVNERLPIRGPVTPPRGPVTPPRGPVTPPPILLEQSTRAITISMPPPPSIPSSHVTRSSYSRDFSTSTAATVPEDIGAKSRNLSIKNMRFKPIAKANSSLKKFFPGDEEEMDIASDEPTVATALEPRPVSGSSFPTSAELQQPTNWKVSQRSSRGEGRGRLLQDPVFEPPPDYHATRPGKSQGLSNYMSGHEQIHTENTPPVPQSSDLADDHEQSSPRLTEPSNMRGSRRSSQEMDSNATATPPDNHETSGNAVSSSSKDLYKILSQVGEGTFGKVYKARNTITGNCVALKRIRMEAERDGFPVTAMREIKLLQSLRHENVVRLYEMMVSNGSVYMVFEYMDHDLTGVLSQSQFTFSDAHLKSFCHQMLSGLAYLHHKGVIHRDIKGSNILINNKGELKLADFGLARFYQKRRRTDYTNRVITLWYRPPELLFGATVYGPEVDMWSAGCIMLELFTKKPVFQGADEIHQVEVVFKLMGTPTIERWADVINLPWFELVKPPHDLPNRFREAFQKWMSPAALDLAEKLLAYDPTQRISALDAMDAPYFCQEPPRPSAPVGLIDLEGEWHELETKRERAKRKERKNT